LLDEPLANLDYKLREELRTELPRIFEASARSSSMRPPSLRKRCCSAAGPSACGKARSCKAARPQRSIAIPTQCGSHRCFPIRPQHCRIEKKNGLVQYAGGVAGAGEGGLYAKLGDGAYRVGFRAHQLEVANGIADRHAFSRPSP